jgi:hypothetical protein
MLEEGDMIPANIPKRGVFCSKSYIDWDELESEIK